MVFFVFLFLVVGTIAVDCLERLISKVNCCILSGMLLPDPAEYVICLWYKGFLPHDAALLAWFWES